MPPSSRQRGENDENGVKAANQHGTRSSYQRNGCACFPCRRANSAYQAALRQAKAKGLIPAGQRIDARAVWRIIKALKTEGFTHAEIARRIGLQTPCLQWHAETVTVRTFLKVRGFYRRLMLEEPGRGPVDAMDNQE